MLGEMTAMELSTWQAFWSVRHEEAEEKYGGDGS